MPISIDEAIKTLKYFIKYPDKSIGDDELDSMRLGIEALKVIHEHRSANFPWATPKLPGETEGKN